MRSAVWVGDWKITQPWGPTTLSVEPLYATPLGEIHWHCGIDVGMPSGTPLSAARAGIVSRTGYGLLGIKSGVETHYYVHIARAVVGQGSAVATGQLIAYSGNKLPQGGYSTGAHLHFERNRAGLNLPPGLDPLPLLQGLYSSGQGVIDDMFNETDRAQLSIIHAALTGSDPSVLTPSIQNRLAALQTAIGALTMAVAALKPSSGTADLQPALDAIAAIRQAVAEMRAVLDKIDRGE